MKDDNIFNKKFGNDDCFIHFDNKDECQKFITFYKGNIGHICCNGKGCKLLGIKNYQEIHKIKNNFLNNKV